MDGSGSHKERNTVERAGLEELVFNHLREMQAEIVLISFKDLKLDRPIYDYPAIR